MVDRRGDGARQPPAGGACEVGLGAVLDQEHATLVGQFSELFDGCWLTKKVHRHDGACALSDQRRHRFDTEQPEFVDVGEDRDSVLRQDR